MPRYLFRDAFSLTAGAKEYAPEAFGRYDKTGYAVNWFPEQFALKSEPVYVEQKIPAPYGSVGQPIQPDSSTR